MIALLAIVEPLLAVYFASLFINFGVTTAAFIVSPTSSNRYCDDGRRKAITRIRNNIGDDDTTTKFNAFEFFRRRRGGSEKKEDDTGSYDNDNYDDWKGFFVPTVEDATKGGYVKSIPRSSKGVAIEDADIIVIGGGVSGLAAAITAAKSTKNDDKKARIVVLEASPEVGGRVTSEITDDGFLLDHGFAVFIDAYPQSRKLLDFDKLNLKSFLPGALIKVQNQSQFARVADPLREPGDIINSIIAPIGSLMEKLDVVPLYLNVRSKSVEELFEEDETDTESALIERWKLSDTIIQRFFKPFLEGIYLAPLSKQSSRMLSFVLKMFIEGYATLPEGGMGAVSSQLSKNAEDLGVDIRTNLPVSRIESSIGDDDNDDVSFIVESFGTQQRFRSLSVVVATDGQIAQKLLSTVDGFESLSDLPEQPNVGVGCLYYSFKGNAPIDDPILILNGEKEIDEDNIFPANNICFPSVVQKGYAPDGYNLCSVSVLGDAMSKYKGRPSELDQAVRNQLGAWFPDRRTDILEEWELKKIFYIPNAQPSQYNGPSPASVAGGRPTDTYRGKDLPSGLFVCGDHMATSSLNGALESGVAAGRSAASFTTKALKA